MPHSSLTIFSSFDPQCTFVHQAFFKFVPLQYGLPFIGAVALLIQARNKIIASRSTDEHIDKTIVKDLVSDEDAIAAKENAKKEKKQRKANQKLKERLKAERKNVANKKREIADDDEDELIDSFAKGSRGKNKTK
eukprot:scaffold1150_cov176-Alexandrium_tamarense.AAC.7